MNIGDSIVNRMERQLKRIFGAVEDVKVDFGQWKDSQIVRFIIGRYLK